MDWQTFTAIMATWTAVSIPLGMALGRFLGELNRMDEEMEARLRSRARLPAPQLQITSNWSMAGERTRVTA